jgi:acetoacetyl-CoA reductase
MTKAVLDHMLEHGFGRIVNISSMVGQTGNIGQANYAASKAGLCGFTKSLARKGITVNCVAPGYTDTEMVAAVPKEVLDKVIATIPVGRLGHAREIARAVRFLTDDDASYITGTVISVGRRPCTPASLRPPPRPISSNRAAEGQPSSGLSRCRTER